MNSAVLVRQLDDWETDSALYQLEPAKLWAGAVVTHVIVSTVPRVDGNHGSLIYAATPTADVRSWVPMARSEHDEHSAALAELGYRLVTP